MARKGSGSAGVIVALCLAESTVTFETSMIYAAMPALIRIFGNPLLAGQLVAVHPLIAAATAPVAGRLGDMRGRKAVILALLGLALAGSIVSALSDTYWVVLIGRALQGLSVAVLSLAVGVLRETIAPQRLSMSIGVVAASQSVGAAGGLVLGGVIVDHLDWHWLFAASAVLIALSMAAIQAFVPTSARRERGARIDWVEALLPMPGIAALLVAIGLTKGHDVLSPAVLGAAAVGLVAIVLWARRALAAREPFIDLRLFRGRNFAAVNAATLLLAMGTMQIIYLMSTYAQSPRWTGVGLGLSATVAGVIKLPSYALNMTAGVLASWLAMRSGHRVAFVGASLIAAAGWLYAVTLPDRIFDVVLVLAIASYGTTMIQTATANVIVGAVPEHRTSEAMGTMSVVRSIGLAIGAQLIAVSLAAHTVAAPDGGAAFPSADGFRVTMGWIAAASLAAAAVGLILVGRPARRGGTDETAERLEVANPPAAAT